MNGKLVSILHDNQMLEVWDIRFNCDHVARIECRDKCGMKHVFKTAAPCVEVGGYHGSPTLILANGEELDFYPKSPDVSDMFAWGLAEKLRLVQKLCA